jgi:NAD-dependent dihydropyrimidine dehydrogenase PreA subunit
MSSKKGEVRGFGKFAQTYIDFGWAREISREEAIEVLKKNEEEGLVFQPGNSQKADFICSCCNDCCLGLSIIKRMPNPADLVQTNFFAEIDIDLCAGCGTCVERCPMDAITLEDDVSSISRPRCIGCGNCIYVCPEGAIKLVKKDKETIPVKTPSELYDNILAMRTKLLDMERRRKVRLEKKKTQSKNS